MQWTLEYIDEHYGDRMVTIRKSDIEGVKTFKQVKLSNYIEYIDQNDDKWYCDWNFTQLNQNDLDLVYSAPEYFTKDTLRADEETGRDWKWFFLGSKQTGTPLHQDFNSTHAWNGVIFGEKEWIFYHPDDSPYLYEGNINVFDEKTLSKTAGSKGVSDPLQTKGGRNHLRAAPLVASSREYGTYIGSE